MKMEIRRSAIFNLELSYKEVCWLKGLMQNSLGNEESEEDREIRLHFWNVLPSFDELNKIGADR